MHSFVAACMNAFRMEHGDWVVAPSLRKETAAETCLKLMRQRLQSGCEACGCQDSVRQLQWHHHNETDPVEHVRKRSGIYGNQTQHVMVRGCSLRSAVRPNSHLNLPCNSVYPTHYPPF